MARKREPMAFTVFHAAQIGQVKNYRNHGIDLDTLILETIDSFDLLIEKIYLYKQGKFCLECNNAKCICHGNNS